MWDNASLLRKIAGMLTASSMLALFCGEIYYIAHQPWLFPLHSVRLSAAAQHVNPQDVLQVVRDEVKGNFFTVDLGRVRSSLEKLPWVRSVNIRREFPDRLLVQLEEHQALARWNGNALVNTHGEVFNSANGTFKASTGVEKNGSMLADLIGQPGDSREISQFYAQFGSQLAVLDLRITQLALTPRHAWQLHLSNGMVLELGREEMEQRLARFVASYPSLAAQRTENKGQRAEGAVAYVDLRYRNGFAVRRMSEDRKPGAES